MWSVSNKSDLPIVVYFTIIVFIYAVKLTKIKINWNLEYLWFRYMYLFKKMHNWGDFNSSNNVCNREWLTGCRGGLIINVTQCQLEHSDSVFVPILIKYQSLFRFVRPTPSHTESERLRTLHSNSCQEILLVVVKIGISVSIAHLNFAAAN